MRCRFSMEKNKKFSISINSMLVNGNTKKVNKKLVPNKIIMCNYFTISKISLEKYEKMHK